MTPILSTYQKSFTQQRMTFGTNLLSSELAESLRRASLACAENQRTELESLTSSVACTSKTAMKSPVISAETSQLSSIVTFQYIASARKGLYRRSCSMK